MHNIFTRQDEGTCEMSEEIWWWIVVLAAIATTAYLSAVVSRRWERSKLRKEIDRLLPQLEAGDYELAAEVIEHQAWSLSSARANRLDLEKEYRDKLSKLWTLLNDLSDYGSNRESLKLQHRKYCEAEENVADKSVLIETLDGLARALDNHSNYTRERLAEEWSFDISPENLRGMLTYLVHRREEELLGWADDSANLELYFSFMTRWEHEVESLEWPESWKNMVLEHVPMPSLELLRLDNDPMPEEADLLWLAAVALRQEDVKSAKVALAYIRKDAYRLELIDTSMVTQLVLLIASEASGDFV